MDKRKEKKLQRSCNKLYRHEAKAMYANWLQQAIELAEQDKPDKNKYWDIKDKIRRAEIHWEICHAPCGYWPQNMRDDSFQVSCALHEAWVKIIRNNQ